MPPVCCWAWTQKALFTIFFVFFRQSCTVTALSSNMHLVLSHRCVQTIWSVWKPPGLMLNRKGQWICPLSGFRVKSLSFLGVDRFPFSCPTRLPLSRNSICLSPWKAATGSAGKLEAAFHCSPDPDPTPTWAVVLTSLGLPVEKSGQHNPLKHTKLLQRK